MADLDVAEQMVKAGNWQGAGQILGVAIIMHDVLYPDRGLEPELLEGFFRLMPFIPIPEELINFKWG